MTTKEIFKKIEVYNEIAEKMQTYKAKIELVDTTAGFRFFQESFTNYENFKKYIKQEYIKETAELILKGNDWELDSELYIKWEDCFGYKHDLSLILELAIN